MADEDDRMTPSQVAERFALALLKDSAETGEFFPADGQVHNYISAQTSRFVYRADGVLCSDRYARKASINVSTTEDGISVSARIVSPPGPRFSTLLLYRLATEENVLDYITAASRELQGVA